MLTSQSTTRINSEAQPHSPIDAVDLTTASKRLSGADCEYLTELFSQMVATEALSARISFEKGNTRLQFKHLNGTTEFRNRDTDLQTALNALCALDPNITSDIVGLTLHVLTENMKLDVDLVRLDAAHGDQWIVRARIVNPVPIVLDTLGLEPNEVRHLRKALSEKCGLISIGTPHRRHLEDWHRAVCRELCSPDKSVISLVPRLLEDLPRVPQIILPPGDRWDQKLWQLASQADADVIILSDDGTHGYAPDQLGVLAERCLVVQILQTPDIASLSSRTPQGQNVHRVIMHQSIRKLCPECKEPHKNPSRAQYSFLDRALPKLSDGVNAWLAANQSSNFQKPGGCFNCHDTGYLGELSIVDSIGECKTSKNTTNNGYIYRLNCTRIEKLIDIAREGKVCLDEVSRLISSDHNR